MSNVSKNEIIAVTGMTGVGKDYLVERANSEHKVKTINWGDLIGKSLRVNRDLMTSTHTPEQIEDAQLGVCRDIVSQQPAIVTCHTIRPLDGRYVYNLRVEKELNPIGYVFISAPAETIAERVKGRNTKGERKCAELSVNEIADIQQVKLCAVRSLAAILNCEFTVINNTKAEYHNNIEALQRQIGKIATKHV